ncbi:MAG: 50S ribosomal protein L4 [Candidatus Omnitrophota bacterium]|nr:50S ribosomal protein L4 [Candidatus Omnitrophota bacterium]
MTIKKEKKTEVKKTEAKKVETKKISSIPVFNSKGKEIEKFELNKELFTGEVNKGVLYQFVRMYNANQRSGTASTKTRGDVSGGGKKPWRQKGTGRARAGSSRSPLWRGGGKVFGPHPRDFHYDIPKKIKKLALLSSLNSKILDEKLIGIDAIALAEPKTKQFQAVVDALKLQGRSLFILDIVDEKTRRASRNIEGVTLKNYKDFNPVDVLNCNTVIMSKVALEKIPERLKV